MNGPVVVVGAGVIGLSVAFELVCRGLQVSLIDRDRPGGGATAAAAGMLAPVSEAEFEDEATIRFGLDSLSRYPAFVERAEAAAGGDHHCGYRGDGTLWVARNRDDLEQLHHLAARVRHRGLPIEEVDAPVLRRMEPALSARVVGGMWVAGDHQVDPRRLARVLASAVVALGGKIDCGVRVERVEPDGTGGWRISARRRDGRPVRRRAERVVLAAGAWLEREIGGAVPSLGLRPVKGQLLRLRGTPLLSRVVRTPDVYLVPREDGELLVGATMEEMGFDTEPTAGATMDLLRHAWEILPGLYDLVLSETCVGLRSAVDDQHPVIGPTDRPGLYLAVGHFRNGVLLAPATAELLAEAIVSGRVPDALLPFAVERPAAAAEERA